MNPKLEFENEKQKLEGELFLRRKLLDSNIAGPHQLEEFNKLLKVAKEKGVDTAKYEAELPALTRKIWDIDISYFENSMQIKPPTSGPEFALRIVTAINHLEKAIKEIPVEFLDEYLKGQLKRSLDAINHHIRENVTKYPEVKGVEIAYNRLMNLIVGDKLDEHEK